jgi:hypothetical protein
MCAEVSNILKAVVADSFLHCWYLEIPLNNQDASTIKRKVFDWKCSRMSMLEVEAVPQSCIQ